VSLVILTKLALIALTPTAIGVAFVCAPRWCAAIARRLPDRTPETPQPTGLPIEKIAADLRRLLRLHDEMTASAHLAIRAHRLWAVEAAIGTRAVEAAEALDVPHRVPQTPGALPRAELRVLLHALADAGLVLPTTVGPFTKDGRL
jgi:hypothetical protein